MLCSTQTQRLDHYIRCLLKKGIFYERNLVAVAYYNFKAMTGKIFGVLQVLAYAKWSLTRGGRS